MSLGVLCLVAALLSWCLTIALEKRAERMGLVQQPNHRSSHVVPTPSGGGVAIAVATLAAGSVLGLPLVLVAAALIAALGFVDDLRDLPAALRFPVQGMIFGGLLWALGPLPPIGVFGGLVLAIGVLLAGLWWLNLFNFMDGIDGLAGSQAVLILCGVCLVWWTADADAVSAPAFWLALVTAAATLGFLLRNWPPARIFMGDAGSNALALIIFAIALLTIADGGMRYEAWLILPAVFVSDATVTLLRRVARGERPWHAHRRHAYQQLARQWGHRRVTLLYGALTIAWALPLAFLAQHAAGWGWPLVVLAYAPLAGCAVWAKAGAAGEMSA